MCPRNSHLNLSQPLSIKIISLVFLIRTFAFAFEAPSQTETSWFGIIIHQRSLVFLTTAIDIISCAILAIGLWQLKELARRIAIVFAGVWMMDAFLNNWSFTLKALARHPGGNHESELLARAGIASLIIIGEAFAQVWFLVRRRFAFTSAGSTAAALTKPLPQMRQKIQRSVFGGLLMFLTPIILWVLLLKTGAGLNSVT